MTIFVTFPTQVSPAVRTRAIELANRLRSKGLRVVDSSQLHEHTFVSVQAVMEMFQMADKIVWIIQPLGLVFGDSTDEIWTASSNSSLVKKIIPVLFSEADEKHIPAALKDQPIFTLRSTEEEDSLADYLRTGRMPIKMALGFCDLGPKVATILASTEVDPDDIAELAAAVNRVHLELGGAALEIHDGGSGRFTRNGVLV